MKTLETAVLLTLSLVSVGDKPSHPTSISITVDATQRHQTIEGFGTCLISWDEKMAK